MAGTANEPWTIGRLLTWTTEYLEQHDSDSPRLEAEVLLAHARGCPRIALYTAFNEECDEPTRTAFREMVKRRGSGEPVAYVVGHKEFYSLTFEVNQHVLIPRPETEGLIVLLLDFAKQHSGRTLRIADCGTGSGILAICAAKHLSDAQVTAIDISPAALEVARSNAERHEVGTRIDFREGDLLTPFPAEACLEVVLSNPPYVSQPEYEELPSSVRDFEPRGALVGGPTGSELIAQIVDQSAVRLTSKGLLAIELSPMIAADVKTLVDSRAEFEAVRLEKDFAGLDRILVAQRK